MVTFDEPKRKSNLVKHGIDLAACTDVFDKPMVTIEDCREVYGEQRLCSLGWINTGIVVLMVWVDRELPHIISCRKATEDETRHYFRSI